MSRVIAVVVCGFTVAACSGSIPGLDFLKSSPPTAALQFESEPPGAEVKASGQICRTPCELTVQVTELSATFALNGYQPQTISVRSETSGVFSTPRFVPNPVHADLRPVRRKQTSAHAPTLPSATHHLESLAFRVVPMRQRLLVKRRALDKYVKLPDRFVHLLDSSYLFLVGP